MKGLLHRLAERAAGTAASLRADARLPYVIASPLDAPPRQDPAVAPGGRREPATRTAARPDLPSSRAPVASATKASKPVGADPGTAAFGPRLNPHQDSAAMPSATAQHLTQLLPDVPAADTAQQARVPTPLSSQPAPGAAAAAAGSDPLAWAEPTRLVAPRTPAEAVPMPSMRPFPSAVPAAAEATEVHVHIGRIEVTALHEPPAPRRPAPARAAPVSLQAYLATKGKA
jgi:hypothetical protein